MSALIHPTGEPNGQFSFERFVANPRKKIVQLGWWLRRLNAIYWLPMAKDNPLGYEKVRLSNTTSAEAAAMIAALSEREKEAENISFSPDFLSNTQAQSRLSNEAYDRLLTENIGFVALHDASANNTVIECIARATPLLVNPLPAVVEYLGAFESLRDSLEAVGRLLS